MTSPRIRGEAAPVWRDSLWRLATPYERLRDAVLHLATRNYEDGYCWCPDDWPESCEHSAACSQIRAAMREGEAP